MSDTVAENKMGVMPVGKLLFSMSVPMMLSMLIQALYNVVDSIFVASINEDALTAVSLAFSIQNFMIALGVGTGVGVSALVSRRLGEKNFEEANNIASIGVRLAVITAIIFMAIIFFFTKPFYRLLTDDPVIYQYSVDYTMVVGMVCIGIFSAVMLEKILQATGRSVLSMITQMTGAVVNIILDPILIFGLLGFPALGVTGAAVATVTGQICSAILGLVFCLKKNPEIKLSLIKYKMKFNLVKDIYKISVPSIILGSVGSFMVFGFNKILASYTNTAVAVFGAYFKLQSFVFMPVFGLNNGMIPIVAYNYGAKNPERVMRTFKIALLAALAILSVGTLVFELIPDKLLLLFSASDNMLQIGVTALRIIGVHFPFAAFCIISSSLFQALGYAVISMVQSIMRQLAVILPVAYILSILGGLEATWWAFPIAELTSVVFCVICLNILFKKVIKPLGD